MATEGRLKELMQADLNRECKSFKELSGDVIYRQATPEELRKYSNIKERKMAKLHKELSNKIGDEQSI